MTSCSTRQPSLLFFLLLFLVLSLTSTRVVAELSFNSCNYDQSALSALSHQTTTMFYHAFNSYLTHAFPRDELKPLSCSGVDSFGGLTLTLVDTLDTLVLLRDWPAFVSSVKYLRSHLSFDINTTVSVFETTIRVLGGLLSAHAFLTDAASHAGFDKRFWYPHYDDALLYLALDLADRLLPVFRTPTSIPYGAVHLQHGVMPDESIIASTAGAGSLILEFGTLTRYTGDPLYYTVAFDALSALHARAATTGLVGNHIDIFTGHWVATQSGVGSLVDSFYEYMLKGYILFGDRRLLDMFESSYDAVQTHVHRKPWYLDADMWSGHTTSTLQSSLSAFFPELQVLTGRLQPAIESTRAHYSVWRRHGCLPEGFDVVDWTVASRQLNYPLRPELIESMFYLHWATNDSMWIGAAANVLQSLEVVTRVACGYAEVKNVRTLERADIMPSFMMSETLKYLYLIFTAREEDGRTHWLRSGRFVITTEAHPLLITGQDFESMMGSGNGREVAPKRRKCARRRRWEEVSGCGYGMGGSDFPVMEVERDGIGRLPADVERQVERVLAGGGPWGLRIGDVFVGGDQVYEISRIEARNVILTQLFGEAKLRTLRRGQQCRSPALRARLRRVCT